MAQRKKYIELRQERDFGQVIGTTFDFLLANFTGFFRTVFTITGSTFVISMALLSLWIYKFFNAAMTLARYSRYSSRGQNGIVSMLGGLNLVYLVLGSMVFMFSLLFTYLTIYSYIKVYVRNGNFKDISLQEVWFEVKRKFWKYLGGGALYILLFVVLYVIIVYSATIYFGLFFLLLIGFYALIYYSYLFFVIIVNEDDVSVIEAFARSFYLVKGRWWFSFGIVFVITLLCYVLTLLLGVIAGTMIGAGGALLDIEDSKYILWFVGLGFGVIGVIYLYMVFCFFIIKNAILYYSFVEEKDNVGLLMKIYALADETPVEQQQEIKIERNKQQFTNEETDEDF